MFHARYHRNSYQGQRFPSLTWDYTQGGVKLKHLYEHPILTVYCLWPIALLCHILLGTMGAMTPILELWVVMWQLLYNISEKAHTCMHWLYSCNKSTATSICHQLLEALYCFQPISSFTFHHQNIEAHATATLSIYKHATSVNMTRKCLHLLLLWCSLVYSELVSSLFHQSNHLILRNIHQLPVSYGDKTVLCSPSCHPKLTNLLRTSSLYYQVTQQCLSLRSNVPVLQTQWKR